MNKSEAAKKRISDDPIIRKQRMSYLASLKWRNMSAEDKIKHINNIIKYRKKC